jgi:hypothetical protein
MEVNEVFFRDKEGAYIFEMDNEEVLLPILRDLPRVQESRINDHCVVLI